jgi:hypothetical protein
VSTAAINTGSRDAALLSAKLRRLDPALREYRQILQSRFVDAATRGRHDEMRECGYELLAYDRWRSFELGRQERCQAGHTEALGNGR